MPVEDTIEAAAAEDTNAPPPPGSLFCTWNNMRLMCKGKKKRESLEGFKLRKLNWSGYFKSVSDTKTQKIFKIANPVHLPRLHPSHTKMTRTTVNPHT